MGMEKITNREQRIRESFHSIVEDGNVFGINYDALCKQVALDITKSHRTLQQSFMRLVSGVIAEYAENCKQFGTDLRNEAAAEFAQKVSELDIHMPCV